VTVNAGNVSTHVRVHASLDDDPSIRVVSDELVVSTGLPDQNSITLFSKFVEIKIDEWGYGKAELDIVFQAADHFKFPVAMCIRPVDFVSNNGLPDWQSRF